jgi:histidinol dehydrogenase
MDQQQRDLRRAAAKAFMESLNKLQETLSEAELAPPEQETIIPDAISPDMLEQLEQAVADIERFMQEQPEEDA